MKEDAALKAIKSKLISDFETIEKASRYFDRTRQALENALAGKQKGIPQYLLDYAGIKTVINYVKVKS